jgi:hypothetical protein
MNLKFLTDVSRLSLVGAIAICVLLTLPSASQAAPVGSFGLVLPNNVRVGDSWVDFGNPFQSANYANCDPGPNGGPCAIDGTTPGDIQFTFGLGDFVGIAGLGINGGIIDLEDDFAPVDTDFFLANFMTSDLRPDLVFNLTRIPFGSGTAAGCTTVPGDVCTPTGSPFTITNAADTDGDGIADNADVLFVVQGTVSDGTGSSQFVGRFNATLNQSAAEVLAIIGLPDPTGPTDSENWIFSNGSATFTADIIIPEPGTVSLFLAGGALLLLGRKYRRS